MLYVKKDRTTASDIMIAEVETQHKTILDNKFLYSRNKDAKNVEKPPKEDSPDAFESFCTDLTMSSTAQEVFSDKMDKMSNV